VLMAERVRVEHSACQSPSNPDIVVRE